MACPAPHKRRAFAVAEVEGVEPQSEPDPYERVQTFLLAMRTDALGDMVDWLEGNPALVAKLLGADLAGFVDGVYGPVLGAAPVTSAAPFQGWAPSTCKTLVLAVLFAYGFPVAAADFPSMLLDALTCAFPTTGESNEVCAKLTPQWPRFYASLVQYVTLIRPDASIPALYCAAVTQHMALYEKLVALKVVSARLSVRVRELPCTLVHAVSEWNDETERRKVCGKLIRVMDASGLLMDAEWPSSGECSAGRPGGTPTRSAFPSSSSSPLRDRWTDMPRHPLDALHPRHAERVRNALEAAAVRPDVTLVEAMLKRCRGTPGFLTTVTAAVEAVVVAHRYGACIAGLEDEAIDAAGAGAGGGGSANPGHRDVLLLLVAELDPAHLFRLRKDLGYIQQMALQGVCGGASEAARRVLDAAADVQATCAGMLRFATDKAEAVAVAGSQAQTLHEETAFQQRFQKRYQAIVRNDGLERENTELREEVCSLKQVVTELKEVIVRQTGHIQRVQELVVEGRLQQQRRDTPEDSLELFTRFLDLRLPPVPMDRVGPHPEAGGGSTRVLTEPIGVPILMLSTAVRRPLL